MTYQCPPQMEAGVLKKIAEVAAAAYTALGCRDLARIDLRFDADGVPNFLEANALPGIQPGYSDTCILAEKAGMSYIQLIERVVQSACRRYGLKG